MPSEDRANIVLVILDDTGWADFGCFGSEISTPTIDSLAQGGVRFTNFHVTPLCSPTRASLLTGRNHHNIGMRFLAETDTGFRNSRGRIRPDIPLLPSILAEAGYGTYLAGKWHLAPPWEISPVGPYGNWPLARGFSRFYGFLDGCTDQYTPELYEDNHPIDPPGGPDYHLSADLVDHAVTFLADHRAYRRPDPFYLQLAFGATHAPFQAPREYIEPYIDVFAKGWDRTREDRLARQMDLGLTPEGTTLTERDPAVRAWDTLTSEEQYLFARLQAAYAGFLEHADAQLGRLVDTLRQWDALDNTLVLVLSDNGASKEGGPYGAVDTNGPYNGVHRPAAEQLPALGQLATAEGPSFYPEGWATAGNTPFRKFKQFTDLGGVRSPLVMTLPKAVEPGTMIRRQFIHAIDIAPTLLDLVGLGEAAHTTHMDGSSFSGVLTDDSAPARHTQYWEMMGHRAIWHDGWRAVSEHRVGESFESDTWRLYNTNTDFSESRDLAADRHDVLVSLQQQWEVEARNNDVFPLDDRTLVQLINERANLGLPSATRLELVPGNSHVPKSSGLAGTDRSMTVTAELRGRRDTDEGVVLSSGAADGGYTLYVLDGRLVFEHHALGVRSVVTSTDDVPSGDIRLGFELRRRANSSAAVRLFIDADDAGRTDLPWTHRHLSFYGLDVGRDVGRPVSDAYRAPFGFNPAVLTRVTLDYLTEPDTAEWAQDIELSE